ncbi:hypothetical protein B0J12DRAFT_699080 [Macrophomina phaseolina]|uniref:Uncharacterized protein n=1 Tax=Macrophomina phaseolina TaxID=35725 RepID=A0ABQ8GBA8_9PEZI|nr:hypothetical protein B0J12DRAFT_699080 [Macrophomina phaseolina]
MAKSTGTGVLLMLLLALFASVVSANSYISSFSDSGCTQLLAEWDGPNGYPNGSCTSLRKQAQAEIASFMITGLDEGCTVTLYGTDGDEMCGEMAPKFLADVQTCYNSSWVYYSIDFCTVGGSTFTSGSSSNSNDNNAATGAIVGGVIGGVVVFALVLLIPLYLWLIRPRRRLLRQQKVALREYQEQLRQHYPAKQPEEHPGHHLAEMPPEQSKFELPASAKAEAVGCPPPAELSSPFDRNMSDEEKGLHMR